MGRERQEKKNPTNPAEDLFWELAKNLIISPSSEGVDGQPASQPASQPGIEKGEEEIDHIYWRS